MKTLLLIPAAAAFLAVTATAQTPATSSPPMDKKAKQESVEATTKAATEGEGAKAAKGSAEAAKGKGTAKVLADKQSKQQAVESVTGEATKGYTQKSAEGSAKAAADKSPKKTKPKMGDYEKELQKASTP